MLTANTAHHPGKAGIDAALTRIAQQISTRDSFAFIEALLAAKDDWLDAADDIHDLTNFYKTQITAWRKLLAGLHAFTDNAEALKKVPQAAAALADLEKIRDNPKPYGQVNRIEPLLALVASSNETLAAQKRQTALLSIDSKLAEVQAKLSTASASPDLRNKALHALQVLKTRIASQTSIAQILYLQGQGGDVMDEAITLIETTTAKAAQQVADKGDNAKPLQTGPANVSQPVAKTTKVIRVADYSAKSYLETEGDVEAFVTKLRADLLTTVRAGQKARLQ